jgi:hypothetical protein
VGMFNASTSPEGVIRRIRLLINVVIFICKAIKYFSLLGKKIAKNDLQVRILKTTFGHI